MIADNDVGRAGRLSLQIIRLFACQPSDLARTIPDLNRRMRLQELLDSNLSVFVCGTVDLINCAGNTG
jgi:hypothetical protein